MTDRPMITPGRCARVAQAGPHISATLDVGEPLTSTPLVDRVDAQAEPLMDWEQVRRNGGPPCYALIGETWAGRLKYCGRAQRWEGHPEDHPFASVPRCLRAGEKLHEKNVHDGTSSCKLLHDGQAERATPEQGECKHDALRHVQCGPCGATFGMVVAEAVQKRLNRGKRGD